MSELFVFILNYFKFFQEFDIPLPNNSLQPMTKDSRSDSFLFVGIDFNLYSSFTSKVVVEDIIHSIFY